MTNTTYGPISAKLIEIRDSTLSQEKKRQLGRQLYRAYMKSPEWQAKRDAFLRSGVPQSKKCYMCGTPFKEGFHVHHLNYTNLGDEPFEDLMVLCPVHHLNVHHHHEQRKHKVGRPGITGANLRTSTRKTRIKMKYSAAKRDLTKRGVFGKKRRMLLKYIRNKIELKAHEEIPGGGKLPGRLRRFKSKQSRKGNKRNMAMPGRGR